MNEFSTAGITVKYSTTSGDTHPTSGYTVIKGIKSTPDFNPEPSTLDVTDLSDLEYKRSISGLKDVGGAVAFNANLTAEFKSAWETLVTASNGKAIWFEIAIPNFDSFYFAGIPSPLGVSGFEVDSVAEISAYITPNKISGWDDASTT